MKRDYSRLALLALVLLLGFGALWALRPASPPKGAPVAPAPAPVVVRVPAVPTPAAMTTGAFAPVSPAAALAASGQGTFSRPATTAPVVVVPRVLEPPVAQAAPAPVLVPVVAPLPPKKASPSRRLAEATLALPSAETPAAKMSQHDIWDCQYGASPKACAKLKAAGWKVGTEPEAPARDTKGKVILPPVPGTTISVVYEDGRALDTVKLAK